MNEMQKSIIDRQIRQTADEIKIMTENIDRREKSLLELKQKLVKLKEMHVDLQESFE